MALLHYAIDTVTGFLPPIPPLQSLPGAFAPWERLVPQLSGLIRSRRIRTALRNLPLLNVDALLAPAERERALLLLSVFANAWVWGGDEPHTRIPAAVSLPLCAVARMLDRPPITHYASMALNNWQLLDSQQPLSADNARMQVQFLGGVDEDWFFMACLAVELAGAPLLPLVAAAETASCCQTDAELAVILDALAAGMTGVQVALARVREWCDPHTYYLRVRPFLNGWPDPGVVYEGVSEIPQRYVGGSAGQSSLVQSFDALLGVDHGDSPAGQYLRAIRRYMPVAHRAFLEAVEQSSQVRGRVRHGTAVLRSAYNAALAQLDQFRQFHEALAQDYIAKPSGAASDYHGTGGTSFASFLRTTRLATSRSKL
jgi:indoleamine 2,3-dioxygenase